MKFLGVLLLVAMACASVAADKAFDIVITNGHIIDGTGSPWYSGDIGVRAGKIAAIGRLIDAPRKQTIDARGQVVAPGFIDMLGQSEWTLLIEPSLPSKIFQGITTEVTGEGESIAPLTDDMIKADHEFHEHYRLKVTWHSLAEYFQRLEKQGIGINFATYVGAAQVRRLVLGVDDKQPTPAQLDQMRKLVRDAMRDGAMGVSSALIYPPATFAKTPELIALAQEASKYGGLYATHIRNEGDTIIEALDEAFQIGREAKIPVEIWHLKAAGKPNWGRMPEIVAKISSARAEGLDVTADTYGYPASFNGLAAYVPPWAHDGGTAKMIERLKDPATRARIRDEMLKPSKDWENEWLSTPGPEAILIGVVNNPKLKSLQGKNLAQIAAEWKKEPLEAFFDLLIEDQGFVQAARFSMSEPDVALGVQQPWVSFDNDSQGTSPEGRLGAQHPHPRAYGTFPRILRKYVREEKKLTLEDAIRKMTSLPAQRMRFTDRGVLKSGMWADIVIFNPETIRDLATFDKPNQLSEGMDYVLVNGVPVIAHGQQTRALPGKVLRNAAAGTATLQRGAN